MSSRLLVERAEPLVDKLPEVPGEASVPHPRSSEDGAPAEGFCGPEMYAFSCVGPVRAGNL